LETILVELRPPKGGPSSVVTVSSGDVLVFGRCPCRPCGVDLVVEGAGVSRRAGRVAAADDHWRLENLSRHSSYVVEHLEDSGQYIVVAPQTGPVPVPFEISRVMVPGTDEAGDLIVFGSRCAPGGTERVDDDCACDPTVSPFLLTPSAKYFLVLVALCEPRLCSGDTAEVPTARDIVDRLRPLPACRRFTESTVQFHIDYLVKEKLRLAPSDAEGPGRVGWKRLALTTAAMRYGLVGPQHLELLPARRARLRDRS
jgi:hypothetical protein